MLKYILNNLTFKYSYSYNRLSLVNYSSTVIDASLWSYLVYVCIYHNYYYYYYRHHPDRRTYAAGSHEFAPVQQSLCYIPGVASGLLCFLCYLPANILTSILLLLLYISIVPIISFVFRSVFIGSVGSNSLVLHVQRMDRIRCLSFRYSNKYNGNCLFQISS